MADSDGPAPASVGLPRIGGTGAVAADAVDYPLIPFPFPVRGVQIGVLADKWACCLCGLLPRC
jgi:hypothetical protein